MATKLPILEPLVPSQPAATHTRMGPAGIVTRLLALVMLFVIVPQVFFVLRPSSSKPLFAAARKAHLSVEHTTYQANLTTFLAERSAPHYVLFTSGLRPNSDGSLSDIPWCPDCGITLPIVRDIVSRVGGSLLEVSVGTKEEWKSASHPLRSDALFKVSYLPTLVYWAQSGPGASISRILNSDSKISDLRLAAADFLNATAFDNPKVRAVVKEVIKSKGKACGGC